MEPFRDYLSKKELGIRIKGDKSCRVIRMFKGEWIEFGPEYTLPMDPELLQWSPPGIPPSTLAVALRIYELDNLWTDLRSLLSGPSQPAKPKGARGSGTGKRTKDVAPSPGKPRKPGMPFGQAQRRLVRPV